MQKLILMFILMSPLYLFAQDTQTEAFMDQLGYKKVDMAELTKKQLAQKPCSTCPLKSKNTTKKSTDIHQIKPLINLEQEILKLKGQIPKLESRIADLKETPNSDPSMLNKYQQALAANKKQIKEYEIEVQAKKSLQQAPSSID